MKAIKQFIEYRIEALQFEKEYWELKLEYYSDISGDMPGYTWVTFQIMFLELRIKIWEAFL